MPVIILFLATFLATFFSYIFTKEEKNSRYLLATFFKFTLFFNVGFMGVLGFIAHTVYADETAKMIGWQPGSPFQTEMAYANLSYGVLGLLCIRYHDLFWAATAIGYSILLFFCFISHLIEYFHGNTAPFNIGLTIWLGDLLLPILLISLLTLYNRNRTL